MRVIDRTADEMVALALQQVPSDPAHVTAADLARLAPVHGALAHEAAEIHDRMTALATRLEGPEAEALTLPDLLAAASEQARLEARHGRVLIASKRLDDFTAEAATALGINLADPGD